MVFIAVLLSILFILIARAVVMDYNNWGTSTIGMIIAIVLAVSVTGGTAFFIRQEIIVKPVCTTETWQSDRVTHRGDMIELPKVVEVHLVYADYPWWSMKHDDVHYLQCGDVIIVNKKDSPCL